MKRSVLKIPPLQRLNATSASEQVQDTKFNSLDSTAFALTDEYDAGFDEHTIEITHGNQKISKQQKVLDILQLTLKNN